MTRTLILCVAALLATSEASAQMPHDLLYPKNIDCLQFEKAGSHLWRFIGGGSVDLGNWDGSFVIRGTIAPSQYVRNDVDLYDVLERQCRPTVRGVAPPPGPADDAPTRSGG